jgi:hypothetical protein
MKATMTFVALAAGVVVFAAAGAAPQAGKSDWIGDWETARAAAEASGRPLFVVFR